MGPTLLHDPVHAAIDAVDAAESRDGAMQEVRVDMGPDRFCMLAVPKDLQLHELVVLVGFLTGGGLARTLAAAKAQERPGPKLEIARVMPT
jgi:hypothetical protein